MSAFFLAVMGTGNPERIPQDPGESSREGGGGNGGWVGNSVENP